MCKRKKKIVMPEKTIEDKIEKLNSIITEYNQYKESQLQIDIDKVLKCGNVKAYDIGLKYCNLISFWALNVASGKTEMTFEEFLRTCLKKKQCDETGNIIVQKTELCKKIFKYDFEIVQFKEFEDVLNPIRLNPDKLYQMRILNGSHFMSCYIQDGILMLSDTSKRGIGVIAARASRVNKDDFAWLMEI